MKSICRTLSEPLLALAVTTALATVAAAAPRQFLAPVALSTNGEATTASVAIDPAGNSIAIWNDKGVFYSTHALGAAWTSPASLDLGNGVTVYPALQVSAAGTATVISYPSFFGGAIYSADLALGGTWSSAAQVGTVRDLAVNTVTTAPSLLFVENAAGDAAIVYQETSQISVIRRSGGTWLAPETVAAPAGSFALTGAAIGGESDVIVAWETYIAGSCTKNSCTPPSNFVVHASHENSPGIGWPDSGPISPVSTSSYTTSVTGDPSGQAVVTMESDGISPERVLASTEYQAGGAWGAWVRIHSSNSDKLQLWNAERSAGGNASVLIAGVGFGSTTLLDVERIPSTGGWSTGLNLAKSDTSNPLDLLVSGSSPAGSLIAVWEDSDTTINVRTRQGATAFWSATHTAAPATGCSTANFILVCPVPLAAAVNDKGHATLLYLGVDQSTAATTVYAATK